MLVWNLQLSIFFMCDWRAGGGPLNPNTDLGLALQSMEQFPGSYWIHVLCPNIRIWLWPPMASVFVCNESLSGDQVEGFFSSGVKERLRLLVQTPLSKGYGLQECRHCSQCFRYIGVWHCSRPGPVFWQNYCFFCQEFASQKACTLFFFFFFCSS